METLDPTSYTLQVRKAGFLFEKKTVTVSGSETEEVTLEGTRSDGIGIQARDGILGVPLRSLMARVKNAAGNVFAGSVTLDGDGRGEIPSVPPGTYTVTVEASGYAPAILQTVAVPAPTVVVGLTPGGSIEVHAGAKTLGAGSVLGTVRTSVGTPYPISLFGVEGRVSLNFPVRVFQNVAPGSYVLTLDGGAAQSFSVTEGGNAVVTFP